MVDAAFNGAGQSPGLQIWRIEASEILVTACMHDNRHTYVNQVHHRGIDCEYYCVLPEKYEYSLVTHEPI